MLAFSELKAAPKCLQEFLAGIRIDPTMAADIALAG